MDEITEQEVDAAAREYAGLNGVDWPDVDVWGESWQEWRDRNYARARAILAAARAARQG